MYGEYIVSLAKADTAKRGRRIRTNAANAQDAAKSVCDFFGAPLRAVKWVKFSKAIQGSGI